jgi:hypothetical protein
LTPLDIEKRVDLTHLKRVRRTGKKTSEGVSLIDIILCAVSTVTDEELGRILRGTGEDKREISFRIESVPRWPAYTLEQLSLFRTLWPVSLRKDTLRLSLSDN